MKQPAVYILASHKNGTLYTGVTSHLIARIWQHRNHLDEGSFTDRHDVAVLVWYEMHATMESAILRGKRIKKWNRDWKRNMIEQHNPMWRDLWNEIVGLDSRLRGNDGT
jgi:putative endonuclease